MKFTINTNRRFFLIAVTSFAASTVFSSCSSPQNNSAANTTANPSAAPVGNTSTTGAKDKINVGVTPVPAGEILEFVKKNLAPEARLDIEIVTFNDFVQNNTALKDGVIDANYFQHIPFMEDYGKKHNFEMYAFTPHSRLKRRAKVEELISLVGLTGKANAYPAQLSGGQKQRVGIARALAGEPKVLLSDEATSALDPQITRSILDLLRDLNKRMGLTILLITHEMGVVKQICDSVAVLNAGKIVEKGYVSDLIAKPESFLAQEFFPHRNGYKPKPGAVIATIAFAGEQASQAIFATLARNFDVDVNILSGSVETVGDRRVGQFHIELEGQKVTQALKYLHEAEFEVEVH
ncbi:MetQ/NlpA family ABC transporter substrate-binding protein [Nostoc sp. NMS9]|uniref:MetQ/NlpA family ABC transporter substrate-binding protein n=1 Tax=Nostoc sp. NMS9 TaxID=2815393 RepID=UPI0025DE5871|nr:MetQ/NlpA family ABC transporter substrate-binding protein [Nostoc sp. NMS9]MBN3943185.1 ATP-binding cassette domain-containing protein [Nostoc sp. NMS9]